MSEVVLRARYPGAVFFVGGGGFSGKGGSVCGFCCANRID